MKTNESKLRAKRVSNERRGYWAIHPPIGSRTFVEERGLEQTEVEGMGMTIVQLS